MAKAVWLLLLLTGGGLMATPAAAEPVAEFFKNKRITLFVGYSAGGGYDTYARTIARHMGRHVAGNPTIIVKNRPGAGSLLLANEVYNTLPRDGTAMATIGRGIPMEPLFGVKEAKFDASKFTWIGSANNEVSICVSWHKTGITTFDQLKTQGMVVGGVGPGADTDTFPKVMNNMIGTKLKLVTGYPGGNDILFAMERGEVDGRCGYSWSSAISRRADWLKQKKIHVLVQMSTAKHPDLPEVPFIMDLAKTERDRKILELIFARQAWGRPFLAPPGVPADRASALQTAFVKTMLDPEVLKDVKRQRLEVAPVSGPEIAKLMTAIYGTPKDIVEAAREVAEKTDKIRIAEAKFPVETLTGEITKSGNGGRSISFKSGKRKGKLKVSSKRTEVSIGGKKAKRKLLRAGMECEFTFQGSAAKKIACES